MIKITEIKRRDGLVVFKRYRLFESKYFNLYLHKIYHSDTEFPHNHPWNFLSIVLSGLFIERYKKNLTTPERKIKHYPLSIYWRSRKSFHKNRIVKPVTTLVLTFGKYKEWGISVYDECHWWYMEFNEYQKVKHQYK